jgi:hypothetical protein
MSNRIVTIVLLVGLAYTTLALAPRVTAWRMPGNQQGYEPVQPIAFSHRVHSGDLQMACLYCHFGAETSRHAGIPPANVCMNCHKFVTAPLGAIRAEDELAQTEGRKPRRLVSPELAKLYAALGVNDRSERDPSRQPTPIAWVKVDNVPDFVYFDHRGHVKVGVVCQTCHGAVETMERVRQVETLEMGWCVNCHRTASAQGIEGRPVNASTDCVTCHY